LVQNNSALKITVFGAGAWGTAVAQQAARKHDVMLWGRDRALIHAIQASRCNERYLPKISLEPKLQLSTDLQAAAAFSAGQLWVIGTAMAGLEDTVSAALRAGTARPKAIVWLCKGIRGQGSALSDQRAQIEHSKPVHQSAQAKLPLLPEPLARQAIEAVLGKDHSIHLGSLSGPSFAAEVALGQPAALVAASDSPECSQLMIDAFHHHQMRVYASSDLVGVSIGGALKNIVAIAAGISDGLGLGNNARAALITRGLAEIARLGEAMGARGETFMGLAGLGDLVLTCTGNASRNRQVGLGLAEGKALKDIVAALGHVAEGVPTTHAAVMLARSKGVELPIAVAVKRVLDGEISAKEAVRGLLARDAKREDDSGPDLYEGVA
jgi:glycerol-3-phosphate dehydrogenase (NAD(P)+)